MALNYHALQAFTTTRHVSQYRSDLADIDLLVDRPSRSTKGSNRSWTGVDEAARTDRPNLFRVGQQPNAVAPERQSERFQQHRPSSPARASAARAQPQALAQRRSGRLATGRLSKCGLAAMPPNDIAIGVGFGTLCLCAGVGVSPRPPLPKLTLRRPGRVAPRYAKLRRGTSAAPLLRWTCQPRARRSAACCSRVTRPAADLLHRVAPAVLHFGRRNCKARDAASPQGCTCPLHVD